MKDKLLYTFFFGYAALKWRRLIRTLVLIPLVGGLISGIVDGAINFFTVNPTSGIVTNYEEDELLFESPNGTILTESYAKSRYGDRFQGLVDSGSLEQINYEKDELLFETPNGSVITESEAKSRYGDRFQGLLDSGALKQTDKTARTLMPPAESLSAHFVSWSDFVLVSFGWIGKFIGVSLVIALISWLIKPFIVKEE